MYVCMYASRPAKAENPVLSLLRNQTETLAAQAITGVGSDTKESTKFYTVYGSQRRQQRTYSGKEVKV